MPRYEKPNDNARSRKANRPVLARTTLRVGGYRGDIDPSALLRLNDEASTDWTLGTATLEAAGADRGVKTAAKDVVVLDSVNEDAYVAWTGGDGGLPVGTYRALIHLKASVSVANDLGVKVRNTTDSTDVLIEVLRTPPTNANYAYVECLFSVKAADAGDTIRLTLTKKTATTNTIRVDYVALTPITAESDSWGRVPEGGRVTYAYASGDITTHTIYDATTGGNVVETAAYGYTTGDLTSIAYTRDGVTMTESITYTSGAVSAVSRSIPQ